MQKRGLFLLLFITLCSLPAATALLDIWVKIHETLSFDNHSYYLANFSNNTLQVQSELYGIIPVPFESILYTDKYEFTFAERNSTHYHLLLDILKPELKAERIIDPPETALNEVSTVSIVISNSGSKDARNLEYYEELPVYYTVDQPAKVVYSDNQEIELTHFPDKISWKGDLLREDVLVITYKARLRTLPPVANTAPFNQPKISYTYQNEKYPLTVKETPVPLKDPLNITLSVKDSLDLQEKTSLRITLLNPLPSTVQMNFSLVIPQIVEVDNTTPSDAELKQITQKNVLYYVWQGELLPHTPKTFSLPLIATKKGKVFANLTTVWSLGNTTTTNLYQKALTVKFKELEPYLELNQKDFRKGELIQLKAVLDNREDFYVRDVIIDLISESTEETAELFEPVHVRTHVPAHNRILVHEINITAPSFKEEKHFPIRFIGSYTVAGEPISFEKKEVIKIVLKEFEGLFNITHTAQGVSDKDIKIALELQGKTKNSEKPSSVLITTKATLNGKSTEQKYKLTEKEIDDIFYQYKLLKTLQVQFEKVPSGDVQLETVISYTLNNEQRSEVQRDVIAIANIPHEFKESKEGLIRQVTTVLSSSAFVSWKNITLIIVGIIVLGAGVVVTILQVKKYRQHAEHTEKTEKKFEMIVPAGRRGLEVPQPSTDHSQLIKYIETYQQYGSSKEAIKQELVKAGWLEEVIEVYLA